MANLGRRTKQEGKVLESYFEAAKNAGLGQIEVEMKTGETIPYETFKHGKDTHAIRGYDHFNGHFSNYTDKSAVFAVFTSKVS